jgi:hypothetical protein
MTRATVGSAWASDRMTIASRCEREAVRRRERPHVSGMIVGGGVT